MWIYLPINSSQSAQEQVDWTSELSEEVATEFSRSATWKTNSLQPLYWQRAWKKHVFLPRLFGRTLQLSTSQLGRELKELQEAIPVRHLPIMERDWELPIPDSYGHILHEESKQLDLFGASLRMSPLILAVDLLKSQKTFSAWVTKLRRHSFLRKKSVLHTTEKDSSYWQSNDLLWRTPIKSEIKKGSATLTRQVDPGAMWTFRTTIRRDPRAKIGEKYQPTSNHRYLNPNFVEWLMGWEIGWTSVE